MLLSTTAQGLTEATTSGERGTCPGCSSPTVARVGEVNVPHWAHLSGRDCDTWYEMTAWHYNWQQIVPRDRREVTIGNHRADAVTPSGWVIEFQHGPLKPSEVKEREAHYGKGIWVVDMTGRKTVPGWTAHAQWRVFLDYGSNLRTAGHRNTIPHSWLKDFANREQIEQGLNWGSAKTQPLSNRMECPHCHRPAICIDPRDNLPKHKVCAEEFTIYGLTA